MSVLSAYHLVPIRSLTPGRVVWNSVKVALIRQPTWLTGIRRLNLSCRSRSGFLFEQGGSSRSPGYVQITLGLCQLTPSDLLRLQTAFALLITSCSPTPEMCSYGVSILLSIRCLYNRRL